MTAFSIAIMIAWVAVGTCLLLYAAFGPED